MARISLIMEKIYLTKQEKAILRQEMNGKPHNLKDYEVYDAIKKLEEKRFVDALYAEGEEVVDYRLLAKAKTYLKNNPKLRNPINWAKVSAFVSIGVAILTLFSILYPIFKDCL